MRRRSRSFIFPLKALRFPLKALRFLAVAPRFLLLASIISLGLPASASANEIGMNVIAKPVTRERIATLPKKQQKAWLDYLERSEKQKAIDKQTLADEQKHGGNNSAQ